MASNKKVILPVQVMVAEFNVEIAKLQFYTLCQEKSTLEHRVQKLVREMNEKSKVLEAAKKAYKNIKRKFERQENLKENTQCPSQN